MTKLFNHPAGGYLLETSTGNYRFTETGAIRTAETGAGMDEAYPDTVVQSVMERCLVNANSALSAGETLVLQSLVQYIIETAQ